MTYFIEYSIVKMSQYEALMIACDPSRFESEGKSLLGKLWNVVSGDRYSVAKMIVAKVDKSKINKTNHCGETCLIIACKFKPNNDIIDLLLENGAEVNCSDYYGTTPLMNACTNDLDLSIVEILLNKGACVDESYSWGRTALICACESGADISIVELLVNHEADVNIKNEDGNTAIMLSRMQIIYPPETFDEHKVSYLMDNGSDLNIMNYNGESLLIMMCIDAEDQIIHLFEQVIAGSNVAITDLEGNTAYHYYLNSGATGLDDEHLKILNGK